MNESNMIQATSSPPAPTSPEEDLIAKHQRLRRERAMREEAEVGPKLEREIEKEELLARFARELGPLGSEFALVDTGIVGDPFVVVRKPQPIQFEKYLQSKMTPADRYDYVAPSVVHPSMQAYCKLRTDRAGIDVSVANALQPLMGLMAEVEAGK